jgi:ADP-heptose:LPS heptosyltransferase
VKQIEIFIRHILLKLLLFFKKSKSYNSLPQMSEFSKILLIRLNRIGDALITTPLLFELKKKLNCNITVLASSQNYFIFNNHLLTDKIIVFNKKSESLFSLIKLLNKKKYDVIIDLHDDVSTTVSYIIAFSNCTYKVGLNKENNKLYTNVINKLDVSKHHVIERMMEFAKIFNVNPDTEKVNIFYTPKNDSIKIAESFITKHYEEKNFLIGINISAGSDARFWGVNKYKELISLLNGYGINILLLCLERDLKNAWEIAGRDIQIFYRPQFDEFAAMVKQLNFLFTPDTSIVHIASAFNLPMFGIYVKYNTQEMIWYPYKSPFETVITTEPTLENVSFDSVKQKFIPFFEKHFYEYKSKQS